MAFIFWAWLYSAHHIFLVHCSINLGPTKMSDCVSLHKFTFILCFPLVPSKLRPIGVAYLLDGPFPVALITFYQAVSS
jgi:hypothetical protein